jgi:hypothetical protein
MRIPTIDSHAPSPSAPSTRPGLYLKPVPLLAEQTYPTTRRDPQTAQLEETLLVDRHISEQYRLLYLELRRQESRALNSRSRRPQKFHERLFQSYKYQQYAAKPILKPPQRIAAPQVSNEQYQRVKGSSHRAAVQRTRYPVRTGRDAGYTKSELLYKSKRSE